MPTETVTVSFVNEPKKNPKFGSIKTNDDVYYSVPTDSLPLFKAGGTYQIEYGFDATGQYRNFKSMAGASPGNAKAIAATGPTKSEEMAVMGIVGRALQGSGTVPDEETLTIMMHSVAHSWRSVFGGGH